jgi:hypothetical protein
LDQEQCWPNADRSRRSTSRLRARNAPWQGTLRRCFDRPAQREKPDPGVRPRPGSWHGAGEFGKHQSRAFNLRRECAFLFRRLQAGRAKPLIHGRGSVGLPESNLWGRLELSAKANSRCEPGSQKRSPGSLKQPVGRIPLSISRFRLHTLQKAKRVERANRDQFEAHHMCFTQRKLFEHFVSDGWIGDVDDERHARLSL